MDIVRIKSGMLRGKREDGCTVFYGIPYAAAPVGQLRWAPPGEVIPWQGMWDCTRMGNRCYQAVPGEMLRADSSVPDAERRKVDYVKEFHSNPDYPDAPEAEDALTLNVWTPAQTPSEGLSVAVWIHGGAFINGSGQEMEFDGREYARRGVILVTLNYRLGLLGFFSHPDLQRETERFGNYGLQDQLAALRWVRENIAAFGGDPDKVTLFGQSAGCESVLYQLCARESRGLFQKVILQSGGGYRSAFAGLHTDAAAAARAGLEFGRRYFDTDSIHTLRVLPVPALREAALREQQRLGSIPPFMVPAVGAALLPVGKDQAVEADAIPHLPSIIGTTSEDMAPAEMARGAINWAKQMEAVGAPAAYVYLFSHQPLGDRTGAFHSSELWYMFGTLQRSWRPKEECDYLLSRGMLDRWCAFIRTGSPNTGALPLWDPYTTENPEVHSFCLRPRQDTAGSL